MRYSYFSLFFISPLGRVWLGVRSGSFCENRPSRRAAVRWRFIKPAESHMHRQAAVVALRTIRALAQLTRQPIRIIFPFAAGGSGDRLFKACANQLACALISMMAGSIHSNQRPDTLMQDRIARIEETSCTARPDHTLGS